MRSADAVPSDIRLSQGIIGYLMEHYQEPSLSVANLAEQFNLTVSYMGSVFKKGKSYLDPAVSHDPAHDRGKEPAENQTV